jgi:hypothetical protein
MLKVIQAVIRGQGYCWVGSADDGQLLEPSAMSNLLIRAPRNHMWQHRKVRLAFNDLV